MEQPVYIRPKDRQLPDPHSILCSSLIVIYDLISHQICYDHYIYIYSGSARSTFAVSFYIILYINYYHQIIINSLYLCYDPRETLGIALSISYFVLFNNGEYDLKCIIYCHLDILKKYNESIQIPCACFARLEPPAGASCTRNLFSSDDL